MKSEASSIIWTGDNIRDVSVFTDGINIGFTDGQVTIGYKNSKYYKSLSFSVGETIYRHACGRYHTSEFEFTRLGFGWFMRTMELVEFSVDKCNDCGGSGLKSVGCCSGHECGCMGGLTEYKECGCGIDEVSDKELYELSIEQDKEFFVSSCQEIYYKPFDFSEFRMASKL